MIHGLRHRLIGALLLAVVLSVATAHAQNYTRPKLRAITGFVRLDREAYAVSAGPTVHYQAKKWSATLTYLPQLFGSPSPGGSRALGEYEKRELRLKIGYEF